MSEKEIILNNNKIAIFMGIHPILGHNEYTNSDYYYYNDSVLQDFEPIPSYELEWNGVNYIHCYMLLL